MYNMYILLFLLLFILIDGGVNNKTINYCKDCDMVVSGSYIINSEDFQKAIDILR